MFDLNVKCANLIGRTLYCLTEEMNDLFAYDIHDHTCHFIASIQKGGEFYCTSCSVGNKIYYFSYFGHEYCIFDTVSNQIEYFSVDFEYRGKTFGACSSCAVFDEFIYVLGADEHIPMVRINSLTNKAECKSSWLDYARKEYGKDLINIAHTNLCIVDDVLWLPMNRDDTILAYNLRNDDYKFHTLPPCGIKYYTVNYDGEWYWLTGDNRHIVKWKPDSDELINFTDDLTAFVYRNQIGNIWPGLFYSGYYNAQARKMIYAPLHGNMFISIDTETGEARQIKQINEDEYCFTFFDISGFGLFAQVYKVNAYFSRKSYMIGKDGIREFGINVSETEYGNSIKEKIRLGNSIKESYSDMLKWFMENIMLDRIDFENSIGQTQVPDKLRGRNAWEFAKKE